MRYLYWTLAVGVLLRVLLALHAYADPLKSGNSDTPTYEAPARNLIAGHGLVGELSQKPDSPIFFRTPGYPLVLAAVFALHIQPPFERLVLLLAQALVWGATILIVWHTARKRFNRSHRSAAVSALIVALDPMCIWSSAIVMTESLFAFSMAVFCYLALAETGASLLGAGLVLGAASLVRPIAYWLMPVLAVGLALRNWRKAGVFALGFVAVVLPWHVRNAVALRTFSFSGIADLNLMAYRAAGVQARVKGVDLDEQTQSVYDSIDYRDSPPAIAAKLRGRALPVLMAHPMVAARMTAESLLRVALGPGAQSISSTLGVKLNGVAIAVLAIWTAALWVAAAFGVWRSGLGAKEIILVVTTLYLLFASAGPEGYSRMRIPAIPAIALLIGGGVNGARRRPSSMSREPSHQAVSNVPKGRG